LERSTLPYAFDTSGPPKLILEGVLGLLLVVAAGIAYSLLVSRNMTAVIILTVSGAATLVFARVVLRHLEASTGTITAERVEVRPGRLVGLRLGGPSGTYPTSSFRAVRFERIADRVEVFGSSAHVSLVGNDGTPDILIARTDDEEGRPLGRRMSEALRLPFEETHVPY
jgi:hypothetical protein